jgi:hypothetical protein
LLAYRSTEQAARLGEHDGDAKAAVVVIFPSSGCGAPVRLEVGAVLFV